MRARYGHDARLLTDGYERSLTLPGQDPIAFRAGQGRIIHDRRGLIQTGRLSFDDGQELWAVFVDTGDGFDVHCFVPSQISNDLVRFDMHRGFMGMPEWSASKCRYRLDGKPLHTRSANDVNATGWSLRTLAEDANPDGASPPEVDVSALVADLSQGLSEHPGDRRRIARRLRAAAEDLMRRAALLEA